MKTSQLFMLVAVIYVAPHVSPPVACIAAGVFGILALLMRYGVGD